MAVLRTSFRSVHKFMTTAPGLQALNPKPNGPQIGVVTDDQIDEFNRQYA